MTSDERLARRATAATTLLVVLLLTWGVAVVAFFAFLARISKP